VGYINENIKKAQNALRSKWLHRIPFAMFVYATVQIGKEHGPNTKKTEKFSTFRLTSLSETLFT